MLAVHFQESRARLLKLCRLRDDDGLRHPVGVQDTVGVLPQVDEGGSALSGIVSFRAARGD